MQNFDRSATRARWQPFAIITAGILLAIALRLAFGGRWFSFYGPATAVLATLPALSWRVSAEHRGRGWRRWPIWLLALTTAFVAGAQIAFWLTFFHGGGFGLGIGLGRTLAVPLLDKVTLLATGALALLWLAALMRLNLSRAQPG
ncbi:MAG: hypothetical protein AB7E80_05655 [Hyphomicrobiaceae bacterium]